jgi:hypothetical protein
LKTCESAVCGIAHGLHTTWSVPKMREPEWSLCSRIQHWCLQRGIDECEKYNVPQGCMWAEQLISFAYERGPRTGSPAAYIWQDVGLHTLPYREGSYPTFINILLPPRFTAKTIGAVPFHPSSTLCTLRAECGSNQQSL